MRPSTKHQNQQPKILADFSGGMNTYVSDEMIADNELSWVVNMEVDKMGKLRTVQGTVDVTEDLSETLSAEIKSAAWDDINHVLLLFCKDDNAYALVDKQIQFIGALTGDEEVITVNWEDGILVASGGHLQYGKFVTTSGTGINDTVAQYQLVMIGASPADSRGVYVRSGRVFVFDGEDNLLYSAVGDEENWVQDSNDPSSAIFTQIGYKVCGRIIGLINLQSYVLVIKDNGKIFRLENEYPDWVIKEVTSNGMCKGKAAYASVGNNVFILGERTLQMINPTDDYGNMPVNYVGNQVTDEIISLPPKTRLRFNADLNQLWFVTNSQWVLAFDCKTQTFFQRYFNSDVVDMIGNFVVKRDKVAELSTIENELQDNGEPLEYRARFKTEMGFHDILVKRVDVSIMTLVDFYNDSAAYVKVGRVIVPFPKRITSGVDGVRKRTVGVTNTAIEPGYTPIDNIHDGMDVFLDTEQAGHGMSLHYIKRQVCREHMMEVSLSGSGFPFILNFISYDRVEV